MKNRYSISLVALLLIISSTRLVAQEQIDVSAKDVVVCPNTKVQLIAPQGALSYEWTPQTAFENANVRNPITTITQKSTFEVSYLYNTGINLVTNGDFEAGNQDFVSGYEYKRPTHNQALYLEGTYTVYTLASAVHDYFGEVSDHTPSGDNYLIANGHSQPNFTVWEQKINVEKNQDYIFQAWAVNFLDNPAQLQFSIDGVQLGNVFTLPNNTQWQHFYIIWNSQSKSGEITIRLLNQRTDKGGNDFGVDDISFQKLDKKTETLTIDVYQSIENFDTITICESELPYTYQGRIFTSEGDYTLSKSNANCSTLQDVNYLHLTVHPKATTELHGSICEGETYTANGFNVSTAGTHVQHLQTIHGCDSTVTLHLIVHPKATTELHGSICEGETYTANGFNVSTAGTHVQHLQTIQGCDSTVTLHLIVHPKATTELHGSICEGETYTANGFNVSTAGTHVQHLQTIHGCDSTVTLHLTVHPKATTELYGSICEGETYTANGFNVSTAGTHVQHLQTIHGCDSTVTLHLTVHPKATTELHGSICEGETYTANGFNVSTAGTHVQHLQTIHGCDSTVTLHLTVHPKATTELYGSICEGETYTANGFNVSTAGTHVQRLQTIHGCDSTVTLHLTVHPKATTELYGSICEGETYTANGFNVSTAGTHVQHLQTIHGCDSTVTLHLIVEKLNYEIEYELLDCKERIYRFTAKNIGTTQRDDLQWIFDDGTTSTGFSAETKLPEGKRVVRLLATAQNGCVKDFSIEMLVSAYFSDYNIEVDPSTIKLGKSTVRMYTVYRQGVDYEWDFGDGSHGFDSDVVHTYNVSDEDFYDIVLTVTDTENCIEERSIRVLVDKSVEIPNTFTPNGDGYNDRFLSGIHIKVFDRKGLLLYEGTDGWDGKHMNKMVADDTYFYIMTYTEFGKEVIKKGFITVIK